MMQTLAKKKRTDTAKPQIANGSASFHRFSVSDYHRMIDAGILTPDHKVELLKGWIVDKIPQNPPHITTVTRAYRWLSKALPEEGWTVRCQGPITLSDSEPEPDIVVARGPDSRYEKRHPGPGDIVLVIEAGDSSVLEDRRKKGPLYAAAKIPQFWLVDLQAKHVEVYTNPQGGRDPLFRNMVLLSSADAIPLILDDKHFGELKVKHLLS
jgi:hypothetical protein